MDESLDQLPSTYATFLRLEQAGVTPAVLAEQLGVELDALPLLAELAHAKLEQARRPRSDTTAAPEPTPP